MFHDGCSWLAAANFVSGKQALALPGARLAMVGRVPGERLDHRRSESLLVHPATRTAVVMQHIELACGHTITAPYLEARGFG